MVDVGGSVEKQKIARWWVGFDFEQTRHCRIESSVLRRFG